jgi:hypothetical protein
MISIRNKGEEVPQETKEFNSLNLIKSRLDKLYLYGK